MSGSRTQQQPQELIPLIGKIQRSMKETRQGFVAKDPETSRHSDRFSRQWLQLPGIQFPASKQDIIKCAEKANPDIIVRWLNEFPDKIYKNKTEVGLTDLSVVFRYRKDQLERMWKDGFEIIIDDRELSRLEQQERIKQQEKGLNEQQLML
jgi:Protein of unknown function (DUF2795)